VSAGYGHSLFLLENGTVEAAGWNRYGQLGDGTTFSRSSRIAVVIEGNPVVTAIAAGYDFSYFLTQEGTVFAVGQNLGGQLGDGTRRTQWTPVKVLMDGVSLISAGQSHGLFLKGGKVFGTGSNTNGQLGDSRPLASSPRECQVSGSPFNAIAAGLDGSCAASASSGKLFCMGSNFEGQLGLGERESVWTPRSVPGTYAYDVTLGDSHSLVLQVDYSDVLVSGSNTNGELGDGTDEAATEFKPLRLDITTTETSTLETTAGPTPAPTNYSSTSVPRGGQGDGFEFDPGIMALVAIGTLAAAGVLFICFSKLLGKGQSETQETHLELSRHRDSVL